MLYIIFDTLNYNTRHTFIGTLDQCFSRVATLYNDTDDYKMFKLISKHGLMAEHLALNIFENSNLQVTLQQEMFKENYPSCKLCSEKYLSGTDNYCESCLESYKHEFCDLCRMCVTTDVENSMWEHHRRDGLNIYCIKCNNDY